MPTRFVTPPLLAAALIAALLALVPAAQASETAPITAVGTVYAGVYPGDVDLNGVVHDGPVDNGFFDHEVANSFDVAGRQVTFAGRFHDVYEADGQGDGFNTVTPLEYAWKAEATPFSNVIVNDTAQSIASGQHDVAIRNWAGYVKRWLDWGEGRSLIIAPLQEMNGTWTPYGCEPGYYVAAYRKFVDTFRSLGIGGDQVRWAFAPNGWTDPKCGSIARYYPGDDYVDVVGISAYNFSGVSGSPWSTPYQALIDPVIELRALVPTKPYLIAQTASPSVGGDKSQWVRQLFEFVQNDPNLVGFVWFNIDKWEGYPAVFVDWNVASGGASGWRDAMAVPTTKYQWPLTDWFHAGELKVAGAPGPISGSGAAACPDGAECDSVGFVEGDGRFHLLQETSPAASSDVFYFGNPGDYPLMGDWDCDGTKTPGQYRQSDGYVYLRNSNTSGVGEIRFFFGNPGDVPLVGDFDGDGCDTVSIYRPGEARIFIINKLGDNDGGLGAAEASYFFGNPGDKPFVGDFDGNGTDTVGLHRESTGLVYFNNEHRSKAAEREFIFGDPGDKIVAGDWNGNGKDSPALYRPSNGRVYLKFINSSGAADREYFVGFDFANAVLAPHA